MLVIATLILGACRRLVSSWYRFFVYWAVCLVWVFKVLAFFKVFEVFKVPEQAPNYVFEKQSFWQPFQTVISFYQKFYLHLYILWPTWKSKICLEWRVWSWFFGSCWSRYRFQFPPRSNYIMFLDVILNGGFILGLNMIFGFGWP
jgi:hypothetical protein